MRLKPYVVTYELLDSERDYGDFFLTLDRIGGQPLQANSWAIVSPDTAVHIRGHLRQFLDDADRLTVVEASEVNRASSNSVSVWKVRN